MESVSSAWRRPALAPGSSVVSTLPGARVANDGIAAAVACFRSTALARANVANTLPGARVLGDGLGRSFVISRRLPAGYGDPVFLGDRWRRYGDNSGIWDTRPANE